MNTRPPHISLAIALALGAFIVPAPAQTGASSATGSSTSKPSPRPPTTEQARENAAPPGQLRPEQPVVPQINVPLGRKAPAAVRPQSNARPPDRTASAAIDDTQARCLATQGEQARAACRDRLAHSSGSRTPH